MAEKSHPVSAFDDLVTSLTDLRTTFSGVRGAFAGRRSGVRAVYPSDSRILQFISAIESENLTLLTKILPDLAPSQSEGEDVRALHVELAPLRTPLATASELPITGDLEDEHPFVEGSDEDEHQSRPRRMHSPPDTPAPPQKLIVRVIDAPLFPGRVPALVVLARGDAWALGRALLDAGANPNVADAAGRTPLHAAATAGCANAAAELLAAGAYVNARDDNGATAAMVAAGDAHDAVLSVLLAHRPVAAEDPARVRAPRGRGRRTADKQREQVATAIREGVSMASDAATSDGEGAEPLTAGGDVARHRNEASSWSDRSSETGGSRSTSDETDSSGEPGIKESAVSSGADLALCDNAGDSAIHYAVYGRSHAAVTMLLAAGADANAKGNGGSSPLVLAAWAEQPEVVAALLEHGADVDASNKSGLTPLMGASKVENLEVPERDART